MGILAKVTAQYFFYKVYFLYLLYILCIGFVTGRDVYVVGHTGTDAETTSSCEMLLIRVHRTDVDSADCFPALKRVDSTRLNAGGCFSSSSETRYEECITLFGLTLVACDNVVIFKTTCMFFLPVLEVCGCI